MAQQQQQQQHLSYIPAPYEQPYYEGLFQTADVARGGNIGGTQAVAFFARSKLQIDTLKHIWTLADSNPTTNTLDRRKFAIAIRLIQLAQNGVTMQGPSLAGPPNMRPAMFDGVSGVSVPWPPTPPAANTPPVAPPQQVTPQQQQVAPQQQQVAPQQQMVAPQQQQVQHPQHPPMQHQYQQQQPSPQQPHMHHQPPPSPGRPPIQPQQHQPQYMQQAPPSPANSASHAPPMRPPMASGGPPAPPLGMSLALTPQDPYTMTPQEQSRYEELFPSYAKPDGYMYGKEAVELFGKSGVAQDTLGKIWNMVDTPVDNKLDKLEFAMAMHLIVCVSKKNLPLPTALPISLKGLKAQQPASGAGNSAPPMSPMVERAATRDFGFGGGGPPSLSGVSSVGAGSVGGVTAQQQPPTPPRQQQHFSQPPPLPAPGVGSMSISDAFAGLAGPSSGASVGGGSVGGGFDYSFSNNGPPSAPPQQISMMAPSSAISVSSIPEPETVTETMRVPSPVVSSRAPEPPPKTTRQLASSYILSDDSSELQKLKTTLQKLQAENISLKAQMGSMTSEEREIQREMAATIEEIGRLADELTKTRASVLAVKTRLLESTAELTGHKEKKQILTDLIAETKETYETLEAAENDIHAATEKAHVAPAAPLPPVQEADLFGDWGEPTGSTAPTPSPAWGAPKAATNSSIPEPAPAWGAPKQEAAAQEPAPAWGPMVETAVSADSQDNDFGADGPLGGGPPSQIVAEQMNINSNILNHEKAPLPPSAPTFSGGGRGVSSKAELENLKQMAIEADKSAREKEEFYRDISKQVDELKRLSDEADADARAKQDRADKKRGLGKKKSAKEAETAAIEAAEKRKNYLEYQAQASNAQAIALESKKEADRLREQAEQAEYEWAAAMSTQDSAPSADGPSFNNSSAPAPAALGFMQQQQQQQQQQQSDTYGDGLLPDPSSLQSYPDYGMDVNKAAPAFGHNNSYGNGMAPQQPTHRSSDSFGFGEIMGGGNGLSIPTPQATDMGYNNPF